MFSEAFSANLATSPNQAVYKIYTYPIVEITPHLTSEQCYHQH